MFIPGSNGCQIVYDFLISKVMKPIEQIIDIFFEEYKEMRVELFKNAKSLGEKIVKNIKKIAEKMKNKQIEKVPTIRNKIEDNINPTSVSTLIPPVKSESLMTKVKSQETKEEDKEKEEHIKFENAINEYSKMMNQESVETQNKDDDNGDLSPLEDNIDDNKN